LYAQRREAAATSRARENSGLADGGVTAEASVGTAVASLLLAERLHRVAATEVHLWTR
jgi:hypothetical protein